MVKSRTSAFHESREGRSSSREKCGNFWTIPDIEIGYLVGWDDDNNNDNNISGVIPQGGVWEGWKVKRLFLIDLQLKERNSPKQYGKKKTEVKYSWKILWTTWQIILNRNHNKIIR